MYVILSLVLFLPDLPGSPYSSLVSIFSSPSFIASIFSGVNLYKLLVLPFIPAISIKASYNAGFVVNISFTRFSVVDTVCFLTPEPLPPVTFLFSTV